MRSARIGRWADIGRVEQPDTKATKARMEGARSRAIMFETYERGVPEVNAWDAPGLRMDLLEMDRSPEILSFPRGPALHTEGDVPFDVAAFKTAAARQTHRSCQNPCQPSYPDGVEVTMDRIH